MNSKIEKEKLSKYLTLFYIVISVFLIYAEYSKNAVFLYSLKPLLMPTLFGLYMLNKKKVNRYFVLSILFMWIANISFIGADKTMFMVGALNTFLCRLFIIILIVQHCKWPKPLPFLIATFPFLIIFITVLQLIGDNLGEAFYFYIINGISVIVLGGLALSNYYIASTKANIYILISVVLFTCMQFVVAVDFYYLSIKIFRPIAIVLFSVAQYLLYKAVILMDVKGEECEENLDYDTPSGS
nr:lysoplasmalogenase family protein [uncultured Flavobacterium sp.]